MKISKVLFLVFFFVGVSFALATLILKSDSKSGAKNVLTQTFNKFFGPEKKAPSRSNQNFVLTAPRVITLQGTPLPANTRSDEYWEFMDTLEPVREGFQVTLDNAGEQLTFMGDLLIKTSPTTRYYKGGKYKMGKPALWRAGRIPYMLESTIKVKEELKQALADLKEETGIEFYPKRKENDYVVFRAHGSQCLSNVGRIGGEQEVWLGPNCLKGEILHELMHTLGFFHEQSRTDRDDFLLIFWENIDKKYWEQFKKIPAESQNIVDVEFDFNSVMLYPPEAFALNPKFATQAKLNGDLYESNRTSLSPLDIEKILQLYHDELKKK